MQSEILIHVLKPPAYAQRSLLLQMRSQTKHRLAELCSWINTETKPSTWLVCKNRFSDIIIQSQQIGLLAYYIDRKLSKILRSFC